MAQLDPQPEDVVVILGQGPIGLLFTMLVKRYRIAPLLATDTMPYPPRAVAFGWGLPTPSIRANRPCWIRLWS